MFLAECGAGYAGTRCAVCHIFDCSGSMPCSPSTVCTFQIAPSPRSSRSLRKASLPLLSYSHKHAALLSRRERPAPVWPHGEFRGLPSRGESRIQSNLTSSKMRHYRRCNKCQLSLRCKHKLAGQDDAAQGKFLRLLVCSEGRMCYYQRVPKLVCEIDVRLRLSVD
jgi:hypothetical protein